MIKAIKLKQVLLVVGVVLITVLTSVGMIIVSGRESVPKSQYTIVVDAGHGGRDNGCSGKGGTKESEINLQIAKELKGFLETLGVHVVMTRLDGNGLYKANADNYKLSDMERRMEIIRDADPDMVISIHQNSFSDSGMRGAQAFYQEGDDVSKGFAESIQSQLLSQLPAARLEANYGDYYLLKESDISAVLVECGYLTNPEEEVLLNTEEYRSKVAYAIMCGVVKYFDLCGQ